MSNKNTFDKINDDMAEDLAREKPLDEMPSDYRYHPWPKETIELLKNKETYAIFYLLSPSNAESFYVVHEFYANNAEDAWVKKNEHLSKVRTSAYAVEPVAFVKILDSFTGKLTLKNLILATLFKS